ncbi:MAG: DEAD/DEAH box helicase family protein [Bacteroidales bacterium]|nr:DEAD/DEAH box helicase family protein [Bacteroidales bacterium]
MLKDVPFNIVYTTGEFEPAEFFLDGLLESNQFDLALGYFSSSGIQALSLGFAYFIYNGGTMRVLINDTLSFKDKEAILHGIADPTPEMLGFEEEITRDVLKLAEVLSKFDLHFFKCLSWLISTKRIEFKAIVPLNESIGIAHHKFGIFKDKNRNKIAFTGSTNFSRQALFNNLESISCFKSWTEEKTENERLNYYDKLFSKIWDGLSTATKLIPIEKVKTIITNNFQVNNIDELIEEEINLIEDFRSRGITSPSLAYKLSILLDRFKKEELHPHFPDHKEPWSYQNEALSNWEKAGNVGFFEMATGTGKTITALNCALKLYNIEKQIQVLVLVPTITLAEQWKTEIEAFRFDNIIIANSRNPNWAEIIIQQINKSLLTSSSSFIITTYATFNLPRFQAVITRLSPSTLIIADEAHNLGTFKTQKNFPLKFKRRIGLSATPERHFDDDGTKSILSFFNALEKPTFEFSMQEAIDKDFLCKYYYYPKVVELTDIELEEYIRISKKLLKFFNSTRKDFINNPIVSALLLKRKRIIHKAQRKLQVFRECLEQILLLKGKINFTLVYVPEGKSNSIDQEDRILINEYSNVLSNEFGIKQHQFIGATKDREEILSQFALGKIHVLTAMKCLDEGIDVKRTEAAIFCASTSNPRQFIQRRGRILRKHPDKKIAYIYDMIVVPELSEVNFSYSIGMERTILQNELNRVREFASMAENKWQALKSLEEVASLYNIDIFST